MNKQILALLIYQLPSMLIPGKTKELGDKIANSFIDRIEILYIISSLY